MAGDNPNKLTLCVKWDMLALVLKTFRWIYPVKHDTTTEENTLSSVFTINGRRMEMKGSGGVVINGNTITLNGTDVDLTQFGDTKVFHVTVEGNVEKVQNTSGDVTVKGNAGSITATSGDVNVTGAVSGEVRTVSGDVVVRGGVAGNVRTVSGDISR